MQLTLLESVRLWLCLLNLIRVSVSIRLLLLMSLRLFIKLVRLLWMWLVLWVLIRRMDILLALVCWVRGIELTGRVGWVYMGVELLVRVLFKLLIVDLMFLTELILLGWVIIWMIRMIALLIQISIFFITCILIHIF